MKKLLVAVAAVLVSAVTYGQGQVNFQNFEALTDSSRGVYRDQGRTQGAGAGVTAQLFLVGAGGALTALTPPTTFFSDAGAEFLYQPVDVTLPTSPGGTTVQLNVRAWGSSFANYDAAVTGGGLRGESGAFSQLLGGDPGGGGTPTPPTFLGAPGFVLVPEPSTIALGVIGGLALLLRRRK